MAASIIAPLRDLDLSRWPSSSSSSVSLADTDAAYSSVPPYARARYVLSNGVLWKASSRCVYRRDEVTAWALAKLLERHPKLPDFDVVLNCRDGPLLRRPKDHSVHAPLILAYSSTLLNAEVAFPDYTLWGLPGKIKPWAQLRLDLLDRAITPYAKRKPRALATGVVNDYHGSLGVRARQAVQSCATGRNADPRLDIRYHRLYFERFYSTAEHCEYKYILLAPGSHAVWLDHLKQKLLCGSLVMLLEPARGEVPPKAFQYDVLSRLVKPGVHYLSIPLPDLSNPSGGGRKKRLAERRFKASQRRVCDALREALDWAEGNPRAAEEIALNGRSLVRDHLTMDHVYEYMAEVMRFGSSLLSYRTQSALESHRMIKSPKRVDWFNKSNFTRVPSDPEAFVKILRNDSFTYPVTAQISADDWADVVLRHNYSRMGKAFTESALQLQEEVKVILAKQAKEEAERKEKERMERAQRKELRGGGTCA